MIIIKQAAVHWHHKFKRTANPESRNNFELK